MNVSAKANLTTTSKSSKENKYYYEPSIKLTKLEKIKIYQWLNENFPERKLNDTIMNVSKKLHKELGFKIPYTQLRNMCKYIEIDLYKKKKIDEDEEESLDETVKSLRGKLLNLQARMKKFEYFMIDSFGKDFTKYLVD